MTPLPGSLGTIEEEVVALPAPCSIHDDRLRALETEQADHAAQLRAGSQMFESVQESIRMLTNHVSDSMGRVEKTVERLAVEVSTLNGQVGDLRVKQAEYDGKLSGLVVMHEREAAADDERKKTIREYVTKVGLGVLKVAGIILVIRYGPVWLADAVKVLSGG